MYTGMAINPIKYTVLSVQFRQTFKNTKIDLIDVVFCKHKRTQPGAIPENFKAGVLGIFLTVYHLNRLILRIVEEILPIFLKFAAKGEVRTPLLDPPVDPPQSANVHV